MNKEELQKYALYAFIYGENKKDTEAFKEVYKIIEEIKSTPAEILEYGSGADYGCACPTCMEDVELEDQLCKCGQELVVKK